MCSSVHMCVVCIHIHMWGADGCLYTAVLGNEAQRVEVDSLGLIVRPSGLFLVRAEVRPGPGLRGL